jgi:hypothetical protein
MLCLRHWGVALDVAVECVLGLWACHVEYCVRGCQVAQTECVAVNERVRMYTKECWNWCCLYRAESVFDSCQEMSVRNVGKWTNESRTQEPSYASASASVIRRGIRGICMNILSGAGVRGYWRSRGEEAHGAGMRARPLDQAKQKKRRK